MSEKKTITYNRFDDSMSKNPIRQARARATVEQVKLSIIKPSDPRFNHYRHQLKEDAVMSRTQYWLAVHFIETLGMKSEDFSEELPTPETIIKDLNLELA